MQYERYKYRLFKIYDPCFSCKNIELLPIIYANPKNIFVTK